MTETQFQRNSAVASPTAEQSFATERLIKPAKRRLKLRQLPSLAPVLRVLAARDLKVKYKQSLLGPLWLVFQPMALLVGFVVAFRGLANVNAGGVPYVPFALVGLTIWAFFQAAMTIGTASIVTNSNLIRYTPCPRPAFPIATVIASLPAFGVTATAAVLTAAATGHLSPRVLLLPLALIWLILFVLGAVALLSALTVRYRDINSALPFLLQVTVFLAPVGYPLARLSPTARTLVDVNPLTGIIEATRWTVLSGYECAIEPVVWSLAGTLVLLVVGWRVFSRFETTMADDI